MKNQFLSTTFFICLFSLSFFNILHAQEMLSPEQMFENDKYSEVNFYRTERMLVSATKNLMEARKAPAINTVITAEEIRNMGARNLFDVLNHIPGVSTSWNQIKGLVNIRGVQTDHSEKVLILIDGVSMNDIATGSGTFFYGEDMMVENIKRVEVVRGPGSALYGANAFIGVINIITKNPEDYKNVEFFTSFGSFNTQNHTLIISHTLSDVQIAAHLNYYDTDGERPVIKVDALTNDETYTGSLAPGKAQGFDEKIDFGLKLKYNDLSFNSRIIDKERGAFVGVSGALNDESRFKFTMVNADITLNKKINDFFNFNLKFYTTFNNFDGYYEMYPEGFTGGNDKGFIGNPLAKFISSGSEFTINSNINDHLITYGLVYKGDTQYDVRTIDNFSDPFSDPVDNSETANYSINTFRGMLACFVQDMWEITAYDSLTLGIRYDHYDDFGGTAHPRIGYVHEFKNDTIFKILYGTAFRAPNFNELYLINNPSTVGNPDLDPETILTFETAVEIPFFKFFSFNLNYFYNEINDLIRLEQVADYKIFKNSPNTSKIHGVESELSFNFGENKYGYINISFQDSEDQNGNKLPYVADWMGNAGYNHEFFNILNANMNISWIDERTRSSNDSRTTKPQAATLFDLTLIARNFYKTLEIKGSVFNLFDEDYVAPSTITSITYDLPLHDRSFLAEISYKF